MFGPDVDAAAMAHAIAEFPRESVGIVSDGAYRPLRNVSPFPEKAFRIRTRDVACSFDAVIHSHPKPALPWPSKKDIECQHESAVPWGIVSTDGITASPPNWFGDHLLDVPLIGRQYVFGVFDCWSLVRSYQWQRFGIKMPDIPRDADEFRNGNSIFVDLIGDHRFRVRQVDNETLIPGDIIVMQIGRAKLPNHVAVMDTDGAMLHHSSEQLSRRDPFYGRWAKFMIRHVRHMDAPVDSHRR